MTRIRPQRVLVQVNDLELGGTQLNALDFADGVREFGWQPQVVVFTERPIPEPTIAPIARERDLPMEIVYLPKSFPRRAIALERAAHKHRASVVHTYGGLSGRPAFWGPCFMGKRPFVMTMYEMAADQREFMRSILVVGTGYLVDDLSSRPGPVRLISPPVDMNSDQHDEELADALVEEFGLDQYAVRLVIVSRLEHQMKALPVILTLAAMRDPLLRGVQLVVAGGGNAAADLRALGREVNAATGREAVVFTGPLLNPAGAYSAADIMIGMGGSAARSLAFGKPLIVSGENGWFKLFDDESKLDLFRNSFWSSAIQVDAVSQLVQTVGSLASDLRRRTELGVLGRAFAKQNFERGRMSERLVAVYEDAINRYSTADWIRDLPVEARWWSSYPNRRLKSLREGRSA